MTIPEFYPRTTVYIPELTQSMTTPLGFDDSMTTTHCPSCIGWFPSPEGVTKIEDVIHQ